MSGSLQEALTVDIWIVLWLSQHGAPVSLHDKLKAGGLSPLHDCMKRICLWQNLSYLHSAAMQLQAVSPRSLALRIYLSRCLHGHVDLIESLVHLVEQISTYTEVIYTQRANLESHYTVSNLTSHSWRGECTFTRLVAYCRPYFQTVASTPATTPSSSHRLPNLSTVHVPW